MLLSFYLHLGGAIELEIISISGLVVEYIVAIDVTRVRFPADALHSEGWAGTGLGAGR